MMTPKLAAIIARQWRHWHDTYPTTCAQQPGYQALCRRIVATYGVSAGLLYLAACANGDI